MVDTVNGTNLTDLLELGDGDWYVQAWAGDDTIFVGVGSSTVAGQLGDDILRTGNLTGKRFFGGDGFDTFEFLSDNNVPGEPGVLIEMKGLMIGIEKVVGSRDDDTIVGTNKEEELVGNEGTDQINGRAGNDTIHLSSGVGKGGHGDDFLYLRANGRASGGTGDDTLLAFGSSGVLVGGSEEDIFEMGGSVSGRTRIRDFEDGSDKIDLTNFSSRFESFDDVLNHANQNPDGVRIFLKGAGLYLLQIKGLNLIDLTPDDFIL